MENNELDTVTLYLDNDETLECEILCTLTVSGKEYIALLPPDDMDTGEESRVYLYRYIAGNGDDPALESIEDDDEFEAVCDAYDEWLDTLEYDAIDLDALGLDPLE